MIEALYLGNVYHLVAPARICRITARTLSEYAAQAEGFFLRHIVKAQSATGRK